MPSLHPSPFDATLDLPRSILRYILHRFMSNFRYVFTNGSLSSLHPSPFDATLDLPKSISGYILHRFMSNFHYVFTNGSL